MRVSHLDSIARVDNDGLIWRPVLRQLGVTGSGINGYTGARAGDLVIEPHDETSPNAGGQEEVYLVTGGRATFLLDGEPLDAPGAHAQAIAVASEGLADHPDDPVAGDR